MKKQLILFAALLPLLGSCVYDFKADLSADQYTVVVEGDIIVGGTTTVRFSRLNPEVLDPQKEVDMSDLLSSSSDISSSYYSPSWGIPIDFTARVEGEDGTVIESQGVSGYCTLDTRSLNPNVRYRLCLEDKQKNYRYASSWESAVSAPVIDSLSYKITDEGNLDVRVTFHSDGSTPYYCLSYDEQWEYKAYTTTFYRYVPAGDPEPADGYAIFPDEHFGDMYGRIFNGHSPYPNYTCWDTAMSGISTVVTTGAMVSNKMVDYVFRTLDKEDRKISVAYRPMVSVRMISMESYAYWKSLEETSTQTGDLFSPIPSLARGNILCEEDPQAPVVGYVGVSVQDSAETFIKANDVGVYREPRTIWDIVMSHAVGWGGVKGVKMNEMAMQYLRGNRPWRLELPDEAGDNAEGFYVWIAESCMDCRIQGGTTVKPKGWPE